MIFYSMHDFRVCVCGIETHPNIYFLSFVIICSIYCSVAEALQSAASQPVCVRIPISLEYTFM